AASARAAEEIFPVFEDSGRACSVRIEVRFERQRRTPFTESEHTRFERAQREAQSHAVPFGLEDRQRPAIASHQIPDFGCTLAYVEPPIQRLRLFARIHDKVKIASAGTAVDKADIRAGLAPQN